MVCVSPLAIEKGRNGGVLVRQIYKGAEHSLRLLQVKNEKRQSKKLYSAIGN
jgi:hypothetical protein